eukprot:12138821-Alexandrium_andersonii.AAC.1
MPVRGAANAARPPERCPATRASSAAGRGELQLRCDHLPPSSPPPLPHLCPQPCPPFVPGRACQLCRNF